MTNVLGTFVKAGTKIVTKIGPKAAIALGVASTGAIGAAGFGVWALVRHGKKKKQEKLERAKEGGGITGYIEPEEAE